MENVFNICRRYLMSENEFASVTYLRKHGESTLDQQFAFSVLKSTSKVQLKG